MGSKGAWAAGLVGVAALGWAARPARPVDVSVPPELAPSLAPRSPATVVSERENEGEEGEEAREEWLDAIHRAPPGVDWKAIEADNVRNLVATRARAKGRRA